jgi:predicted RNA-binding Zn-ribbon protein involved in translation (DUF1610 family)
MKIDQKLTAVCSQCGAALWWEDQELTWVCPFCLDLKYNGDIVWRPFAVPLEMELDLID